MKKILTFAAALILTAALYAAEFAQQHNWVIITGKNLQPIEKTAAEELQLHLSKTFSAPVKLNNKVPGKIRFFIGLSEEARNAGFAKVPAASELPGKFGICRRDNDFLLYGCDTVNGTPFDYRHSCGTLLAAEYFAQKYLKTKFFLPGKDGVKYQRDPEVKFSALWDAPHPSFTIRGFQTAGKGVARKDMMLFYRRRLGEVPPWSVRNYYYTFLNKWNKRFKNKPEMFALHGNKRINAIYPRHFPCTSNPEVLKQVVDDVSQVITKRPAYRNIRFFCDAPVKSCECNNCKNSPAGKVITSTDHSETVYAFFSRIAHELLKVRPDLVFHIQTKGTFYNTPPVTEKLPPNTVIAILSGHYNAPDYHAVQQLCLKWKAAGAAHVMLHCYPRPPGMKDYPVMNPHRLADHFKKLYGYSEGLIRSEGSAKVPYSFSALNNFVHSAVVFDVSRDTDELINEFCQLAAPQASKELQAFYSAMEDLLKGAGFWDDPLVNCYLSFRLTKPRQLLDEALKKDAANPFLKQLSADFAAFEKKSAAALPKDFSPEKLRKLMDAMIRRLPVMKLMSQEQQLEMIPCAMYQDFQGGSVGFVMEDNKLKIRINCHENNVKNLVASCTENHRGSIWSDDVIEIFLSAPGEEDPCIHLATNSRGVMRVLERSRAGKTSDRLDFPANITARVNADSWSSEIAIPLSELKKLSRNGRIAVGVFRSRPARKGDRKGQQSCLQKPFSGSFRALTGRFEIEL